MAPELQTRVPMIMRLSEAFHDRFAINVACLSAKKEAAISHDNLFHSLLGKLDIATVEHHAELDVFASCTSRQRIANR